MLYLHGIGHFHPDTVIDNDFLTSLDIGVDPAWIEERVGIRERRTGLSLDYIRQTRNRDVRGAAEGSTISSVEMGKRAAELALQRAQLNPSAIRMVVAGGCCPEMLIPAEASRIAAALKIDALTFDVNAASSSFAAQAHVVSQLRDEAIPDFVMLLNVEAFTRTVDYSDRQTAVLFGDAATAAIVSPRIPCSTRILRSSFCTDPVGHNQITIRAGGHFAQEGHRVQMFAIRKTAELIETTRPADNGLSWTNQFFIGHQANMRVLEAVCRRLNIPAENHLSNVEKFGNCGAAGAPSVLSQHWDTLECCAVHMAVVGSGLSWGSLRICRDGHAVSALGKAPAQ